MIYSESVYQPLNPSHTSKNMPYIGSSNFLRQFHYVLGLRAMHIQWISICSLGNNLYSTAVQ